MDATVHQGSHLITTCDHDEIRRVDGSVHHHHHYEICFFLKKRHVLRSWHAGKFSFESNFRKKTFQCVMTFSRVGHPVGIIVNDTTTTGDVNFEV